MQFVVEVPIWSHKHDSETKCHRVTLIQVIGVVLLGKDQSLDSQHCLALGHQYMMQGLPCSTLHLSCGFLPPNVA